MIDFVVAGKNVKFFNRTVFLSSSWVWTFGDASGSTVKEPSHTYSDYGTYTVTLTATCGSRVYTAEKIVQIVNEKSRIEAQYPVEYQTEADLVDFQTHHQETTGTGPTTTEWLAEVDWSVSDSSGQPLLTWSYFRTHGGSPHTDGTQWIYYGPTEASTPTGIFDTNHVSPVSASGTTLIPAYGYWILTGTRIIENTTQYQRDETWIELQKPSWHTVLTSVFNEYAYRVDSSDLRNLRFALTLKNTVPNASYETTIYYYRRAIGDLEWTSYSTVVVSFTATDRTYVSDPIYHPNSDDGYETIIQGIGTVRVG